jgi:opacity protein-like surface antigen/outer membrane protease
MRRGLLLSATTLLLSPAATSIAADLPPAPVVKAPPPVAVSEFETDFGLRFFFGSGTLRTADPLNGLAPSSTLISRLVYSGLTSYAGEAFGRVDHVSGLFAKGLIGFGTQDSGRLHDEDLPFSSFLGPYSNTLSSVQSGTLSYGNIDLGYSVLRTPGAKLGPFVGYSYYHDGTEVFNCPQLADNPFVGGARCPPNTPVISESATFQSLRLGLSGVFMLTDRLQLTTDVAYLPLVYFSGTDDHFLRDLTFAQSASTGDGVQAEAFLSYALTDAWSVGIGGRYWAWNTRDGTETATGVPQTARFSAERYGGFLQTSYQWGAIAPVAPKEAIYKAPPIVERDWSGFYIGGHVGSGWGDNTWSDPFPSETELLFFETLRGLVLVLGTNPAGFGDVNHVSGPLGGGQIGYNYQLGHTVLGVQVDASAADLRGDGTCFSGLGGANCSTSVDALGTLTGRLGYAWDRTLLYANAGGAWSHLNYSVNLVNLFGGAPSIDADRFGWTVGGGIEYAIDTHWSATLDYNYMDFGSSTFAFGTTPIFVNGPFTFGKTPININQQIQLVKFGVNYKFDSLGPFVVKN